MHKFNSSEVKNDFLIQILDSEIQRQFNYNSCADYLCVVKHFTQSF